MTFGGGLLVHYKKYIKEVANKKKDVKICDTNPIHWTNNNHNRLQGILPIYVTENGRNIN